MIPQDSNDPEYVKFVNRTYSKGFSPNQSLPHVVMKYAKLSDKILDFGAGKDAFGTKILRDHGFNCTAWDIGKNFVPGIHEEPSWDYDIIFASNVLNVQPTQEDVCNILLDVQGMLKDHGLFFCNFPKEPRHNTLNIAMLESILRLFAHTHDDYGGKVEKVGKNVWKCEYKR